MPAAGTDVYGIDGYTAKFAKGSNGLPGVAAITGFPGNDVEVVAFISDTGAH